MRNTRYITAATATAIGAITAAVAGATAATTSAISARKQREAQADARAAQDRANAKAEAEQKKATNQAEYERLSALSNAQDSTKYANAWGVDDALSSKYAENAKDVSKEISDQEENNPFYTRGLL